MQAAAEPLTHREKEEKSNCTGKTLVLFEFFWLFPTFDMDSMRLHSGGYRLCAGVSESGLDRRELKLGSPGESSKGLCLYSWSMGKSHQWSSAAFNRAAHRWRLKYKSIQLSHSRAGRVCF